MEKGKLCPIDFQPMFDAPFFKELGRVNRV
jgi:hypothetical protein